MVGINVIFSSWLDDVAVFAMALLFAWYMPGKEKWAWRMLLGMLALALFQFGAVYLLWAQPFHTTWFMLAMELHSILLIGEAALLVWLHRDTNWCGALYCAVLGYAMEFLGSSLMTLLQALLPLRRSFAVELAVFCVVVLISRALFVRRMRGHAICPKASTALLGLMIVVLLCMVLPAQFNRFEIADDMAIVISLTNTVLSLVISEMLLEMLFTIEERNTNEHLSWMLEQKKEQYENAKATTELVRVKYHDLKHLLTDSLGEREVSEALSDELREGIRQFDLQFETGCKALDVVLMEKAARCARQAITFSCMADGAALIFMRSVDIYTLFSNALDNAIEAAAVCPEEQRVISMNVHRSGNLLRVHVENSYVREPIWRDGQLVSSKTGADWHGYGTRSIALMVEKYGGTLQMQAEDGIFTLDILFYPEAQESK